MKKMFLVATFLIFSCATIFAADDVKTYKESISRWGASPLAGRLQEKLATNSLVVEDVREILEQGSFPYNKSVHGLIPVSGGKKTVQVHYKTKFVAEDFFITFSSRSLGPRVEIPAEAIVTFLKKKKPDSSSKKYEYSLTTSNGDAFNFSLTWQKIVKQNEKKMKDHRHQQALMDATDFRRPPSIYNGISPQDIQEEFEKERRLEEYIERSKAERKAEDEKRQSAESSSGSGPSGASEKLETDQIAKTVSRQRSYSALASKAVKIRQPEADAKASSSESKGEEPRQVSFAIADLDSLRTKKEEKVAAKQINKRSAFAQNRASSVPHINAKEITKAAKKVKKEKDKEIKKKK